MKCEVVYVQNVFILVSLNANNLLRTHEYSVYWYIIKFAMIFFHTVEDQDKNI